MSVDNGPAPARPKRNSNVWAILGVLVGVAGVAVGAIAFLYPRSPVPPKPPKERPQYIAQVDALCRTAIGKFAQYGPMPKGDNHRLLTWTHDTNDVFDELFANWKAIRFPEADEAKIRAVLDEFKAMNAGLHTSANSLEAAVEAYDAGHMDTYQDLSHNMSDEWEAARKHAVLMDNAIDAYGFQDCAGVLNLEN